MPKKPRSHDLGEEAVDRFKALLPPSLMYRPKLKDYGIDGEVEEFDENAETTGLVFLVQVKGTDERNISKALSYSLPRDHVTYYRNLTLPVLMVRYVAAADTIYTRWSHSLDTYGKKAGWKTATFRWDEQDAWNDSRADELVAEARAFLSLRSAQVRFPLEISGDLKPPGEWGIGADEIYLALKRQIAARADLLQLGTGLPGGGRLIVRPDRLAVEFARVTAVTAHIGEGFQADADQIARDLLALCGLALEHFGQFRAAGLLSLSYLPGSVVLEDEEAVVAIQSAMTESRLVTEALVLAETLDHSENDRNHSLLFTLVALHHSATLNGFERQAYKDAVKRRIERREPSPEKAREVMNLAQFELVAGDPATAALLHEEVLALDPSYERHAHYRRERAGALFLAAQAVEAEPRGAPGGPGPPIEMWGKAVTAYEKLVALADEPRDHALLADALMFAGHYQAALDVLSVFNQESDGTEELRDDEWILKQLVLSEIVNGLGVTKQDRQVVVLEPPPTGEDELLNVLLARDALTPMVWWNLGAGRFARGDVAESAVPFLAAAVISGWDASAWAHAFVGFFVQERLELLPKLLSTGERMTGAQMVSALTELVKAQSEKFPREQFLAALRQQVDALPSDMRDGTTVRIVRADGNVESVLLPGAASRSDDASRQFRPKIPKVGRNDLCPCGSGRKYKKCHGAT